MHWHEEGELSWLDSGVQRVMTEHGTWIVPLSFAVWLPSDVPHDGYKLGRGSFHWTKLRADVCARMPRQACAVRITPLVADALRQLAQRGVVLEPQQSEILALLHGELLDSQLAPVVAPLARPALLQPIIARLEHEPADDRPLDEWARFLRISSSTLSRLFRSELGVSFGTFRQQLRLLAELERLALGDEVTQVARLGLPQPEHVRGIVSSEARRDARKHFKRR